MSATPTERVALVTGASQGIGKGIALELGWSGVTVYVTARRAGSDDGKPLGIDATAEEIRAGGGTCIPMRCDHGDDAQVQSVFDEIERVHGRLDLLVNN